MYWLNVNQKAVFSKVQGIMDYVWCSANTYYISIHFEFCEYILSFHFGTTKVSIIVVSEHCHSFFFKKLEVSVSRN
jgi:hypothetical protein